MKNKKGKSFLGMLLLLIAIGVFGYFCLLYTSDSADE